MRQNRIMPTVCIETAIIGSLTARSSDAVIFLARQQLTRQKWNGARDKYELVSSQSVVDEASGGGPRAAQERLVYLAGLPLLHVQHLGVAGLADRLIAQHLLPQKAAAATPSC